MSDNSSRKTPPRDPSNAQNGSRGGEGKPNNLHGNKKANAGLRVHGQPTIRATHQQPNMCSPKAVEKANAKCLKQNWQWESHPMKRQPLNLERRTAQNTCKKCNRPV